MSTPNGAGHIFCISSAIAAALLLATPAAAQGDGKEPAAEGGLTVAATALNAWTSAVANRLNDTVRMPYRAMDDGVARVTHVRMVVGPSGTIDDVRVHKPSGSRRLDREAVRVARALETVPELPGDLKGRPAYVDVLMYFATADGPMDYIRHVEKAEKLAQNGARMNQQIAISVTPVQLADSAGDLQKAGPR